MGGFAPLAFPKKKKEIQKRKSLARKIKRTPLKKIPN